MIAQNDMIIALYRLTQTVTQIGPGMHRCGDYCNFLKIVLYQANIRLEDNIASRLTNYPLGIYNNTILIMFCMQCVHEIK